MAPFLYRIKVFMSRKTVENRFCSCCRKTKFIGHFEKLERGYRSICSSCKTAQRAVATSVTPEAYLKRLHKELQHTRKNSGFNFALSYEDVLDIWTRQDGRCALSGVVLTHHRGGQVGNTKRDFNASIDRIDPTEGYVPFNVQLVANRVNTMKHTLGEDMFLWWIRTIYDHKTKC